MTPTSSAVLVDAKRGLDEEAEMLLDKLAQVRQPKLLLINKVDLVDKPALLTLAKAANARAQFAVTFMISALSGDGVADVKALACRATLRPDRGTTRRTRSPTRRCASSPPRSRARSSICVCTRSCPTSRRSKPSNGRS